MTHVQALVSEWWDWVTALSWQLALLVVLTLVATRLLANAPPRVRHTLWLLVLIRVFLPTTMSAPWSINSLMNLSRLRIASMDNPTDVATPSRAGDLSGNSESLVTSPEMLMPRILCAMWLLGVVGAAFFVVTHYRRLRKKLAGLSDVDEGPLRVAIEQAALRLQLKHVPDIRISEEDVSPFLIGTIRPCVVVSRTLIARATPVEVESVFLHELAHWKHGDTWIGWLQVTVQCLMWFHPFVWIANTSLRDEREAVCDEAVLKTGGVTPDDYGETLLRVLTAARGRSVAAGGLVGVFERGGRIQNRLESVMKFDAKQSGSVWGYSLAAVVFAILFLPMAAWDTATEAHGSGTALAATNAQAKAKTTPDESPASENQISTDTEKSDKAEDVEDAENAVKPVRPQTSYPQLVQTEPAAGAINVDAKLSEIQITFDRDMATGMSWTGGGPEFPAIDQSRKAQWINKRTCVLPVRLGRGKYYRVGINSKSHQNFRAADGTPSPPSTIFFTTTGASRALQNKVRIPQITKLTAANDAQDVPPGTRKIRVTFNLPMGAGMSWTGGGEAFPAIHKGARPVWSKDQKTCTLPVSLKPNHQYSLGLNSLSHSNFQSKWGVPLKPVVYQFQTSGQ